MSDIGRRGFLLRTGLALSAAMLARANSRHLPNHNRANSSKLGRIRIAVSISPKLIHLAAFFLASHPHPRARSDQRHRAGLDADPIGYWYE